jgi:hypothetical protein
MTIDHILLTARNVLAQAANIDRNTANAYIQRADRKLLEKIAAAAPEEAARLALKIMPPNDLVEAPPEEAHPVKKTNKREARLETEDSPASNME